MLLWVRKEASRTCILYAARSTSTYFYLVVCGTTFKVLHACETVGIRVWQHHRGTDAPNVTPLHSPKHAAS